MKEKLKTIKLFHLNIVKISIYNKILYKIEMKKYCIQWNTNLKNNTKFNSNYYILPPIRLHISSILKYNNPWTFANNDKGNPLLRSDEVKCLSHLFVSSSKGVGDSTVNWHMCLKATYQKKKQSIQGQDNYAKHCNCPPS